MTDVQITLLELLKASLFQAEPHFPAQVDWEQVYQEAKAQAVVALAAPAVPQGAAGGWAQYARRVQAVYMRLMFEQTRMAVLFEARGVPMVILKGAAAAVYYPVPWRRSTGDVDFFVPPERFEEARRLMEENGYKYIEENDRHVTYTKGPVEFEMHRSFSYKGCDIDAVVIGGLCRAEKRELNRLPFPVLPACENGMTLLAHIRQHIKTEGIGLRQIIDWMMFVHAELDDETWKNRFQAMARAAGLETLALTVTRLCKTRLGLPDGITWCDGADGELAEMVLGYLFDNGNFGRKYQSEEHTMDNITKGLRKQGFFGQMHASAMRHWPAAQKNPLLWPAAWLRQIGRWCRSFKWVFSGKVSVRDVLARVRENESLDDRLGI